MTIASDTVILNTPRGHEVHAQLDYEQFEVREAKVVHTYTGRMHALDVQTTETLARALKAKQVYEHALTETREAERALKQLGGLVLALGEDHPAVEPYQREADRHKSIARDMYAQARHFHDEAMAAIDALID